jgi:hypothetical protein
MDTIETALEIKFLGTGGAFEVDLGNSSAIVHHGSKHYLIDCGHSVFPKLVQNGLVASIDGVFITHLHDDHAGSLSTLILYYSIVLQKGRLKLYVASPNHEEMLRAFLAHSLGNPDERVDFRPLTEIHGCGAIDTFGKHVEWMQTYGIYFTNGHTSIAYSGDNGDPDYFFEELQRLDLPKLTVFHEVFFHFRLHAHAYYQDLMAWSDQFSILGYHCDPKYNPDDSTLELVAHHPEYCY